MRYGGWLPLFNKLPAGNCECCQAGVSDQAIRDAVEGGMSFRKPAEALKVSLSTVQRAMKA